MNSLTFQSADLGDSGLSLAEAMDESQILALKKFFEMLDRLDRELSFLASTK